MNSHSLIKKSRCLSWVLLVLVYGSASGCLAMMEGDVNTDAAAIKSGTYQLDQHHATLLFKVQHMGLAPYVGRFNEFDASIRLDQKHPDQTTVTATISTASIDVNYPSFAEELAGPDWFNSAQFPRAAFRSTTISWSDNNHAVVQGELTLLGVTAPVTMTAEFIGATRHVMTGTYTLGFSGQLSFKRSAFGLSKFVPVVSDDVTVEIYAEFMLQ